VIHRDFFKAAISGATSNVLPTLEFQYPNVNFNDRNSVLATAKALEDTGVAATTAQAGILPIRIIW
jgi:ArsR family metal-binding transcriptional regulator